MPPRLVTAVKTQYITVNAVYVKLIAVRFLSKRLEVLQIVDYHLKQEGKVFFGAWVELEDEEGEVKQYRLVGWVITDPG